MLMRHTHKTVAYFADLLSYELGHDERLIANNVF